MMETPEILYADRRICVCLKPAGVLSTDEPGGMPEMLRAALGSECIRTVHRLDQAVSGLMVFARSRAAASLLSAQIRNGTFEKEYLAVVHGTLPEERGTFTDLLLRDRATRTTRVVTAPGKDVQEAALDYARLAEKDGLTLVRIHLRTGRTHQIRVQFASRGLPLWGDKKYGVPGDSGDIALFARRLSFRHPETDEKLEFSARPPETAPWTRFSLSALL